MGTTGTTQRVISLSSLDALNPQVREHEAIARAPDLRVGLRVLAECGAAPPGQGRHGTTNPVDEVLLCSADLVCEILVNLEGRFRVMSRVARDHVALGKMLDLVP